MGTARMLLPSLAELILHHVAMKELGAEELWAQACIQQAWPDCQVAQYDDGSRPSMYDLKITYPDGSIGALEVTAAADAEQVELWKLDYAVELALLDADSIRAINGGVYPPKWPSGPGHSVDVLLRIYARCVVGQDKLAKRRISEALRQDCMNSRRSPTKPFRPDPPVILDLGTYWAQRPAFRRPRPHTAAHEAERQDHAGPAFLQVTGPELRFRGVGRLGLEPRTGGL